MNDLANSTMTTNPPKRIDFNTPELQRKRRIRALKDRLTRWYVLVGGLAVLGAITLIFFFLAYVVAPLFQGASLTSKDAITPAWMQDAGKPLMISLEEQNQVAMRVSDKGQALFFDIDRGVELKSVDLPKMTEPVKNIFVDPRQQWLYVINGRAQADVFSLRDKSLNGRYKLLENGEAEITASTQLVGGISLILGDSKGGLAQWFMARDPDGEQRLKQIRTFEMGTTPIVEITAEERRKGFVALDASGKLGVFHSTAHRTLLVDQVVEGQCLFGLSPRANRVIVEAGGKLQPLLLDNPHPEVSWSALWSKVWYENYDEPKYVWQSTAANTDFEPKLSLAPLTFV